LEPLSRRWTEDCDICFAIAIEVGFEREIARHTPLEEPVSRRDDVSLRREPD
jgi:hypothetical protein